jgi:hypothetical protein
MLIATSGDAPDFSADDRSLITVSRNSSRTRYLIVLTGSKTVEAKVVVLARPTGWASSQDIFLLVG